MAWVGNDEVRLHERPVLAFARGLAQDAAVRILITCGSLDSVGGVQAYTRDLAAWLLARGHSPIVYGPRHGRLAAQLTRLTVPHTDDLATIAVAPDLIHGNSSVETMTALLHFTNAPAIYVCHGWRADLAAPRFPRILRYVAVDDTCADRLLYRDAIAPERIEVLLNAVDLTRFQARATPLPPRPKRALIFSNGAHAATQASILEEACRRHGIAVDVIGEFAGTAVDEPAPVLRQYDLIFAKAKCALEGMASGAAVIVCEGAHMAGLVTSENVARLRRLNFGIRSLSNPLTLDAVSSAIAAYDAGDAARVSHFIRENASAADLHEQLLALHEAILAEFRAGGATEWQEESRAAAAYLRLATDAVRPAEANLNLIAQATHRVLRTPFIGPPLTRIARWMVNRGKEGGRV